MIRSARNLASRVLHSLGLGRPLRFGSLRRVTPISRSFGRDRGWPLDRHYIEAFLRRHRDDVRGHVLEAGGFVTYAKDLGGDRITRLDILYPKAGFPDATLIADLESGEHLPSNTFDTIILTQVFPFIYDVRTAIRHTSEALKPGGVVLATVPGISQMCRFDPQQWGDYWRFTVPCVRRLFGDVFGRDNVAVEAYGNVLVACGFLHGLAIQDLRREELDYNDPDYPLSIAVRAVKARD